MVGEEGMKDEEKLEFDSAGEALGYISLDQARVLAMRTAVETPGAYGRRFRGIPMAFEVTEAEETEDHYVITLAFRPQGEFAGTLGREQFYVEKEGVVAVRQVLSLPKPAGRWRVPVTPIAIGLIVLVLAAGGSVVFVAEPFGGGGDGGLTGAIILPTDTPRPVPTATSIPTPAPTPTARISLSGDDSNQLAWCQVGDQVKQAIRAEWSVQWYENIDLTIPTKTETFPATFDKEFSDLTQSLRALAAINVPGSERQLVEFGVGNDDGAMLLVDGLTLIDDWNDGSYRLTEATAQLSPGEHELELKYFNKQRGGFGGVARLSFDVDPAIVAFSCE